MNARRLNHFATLLRQERNRISTLLTPAAAPAAVGCGASSTGAETELGTTGLGPDDDSDAVAYERAALHEIDDAIRRIMESPDDYGICVRCGRPIADERLELLPAARECGRQSSYSTTR